MPAQERRVAFRSRSLSPSKTMGALSLLQWIQPQLRDNEFWNCGFTCLKNELPDF